MIAVDAAHMLAIVDDGEAWTARGVEIASQSDDPGVRYWLGPLYNNLGWSRYDDGDAAGALEAFELALAAREQDESRPHETEIARYTVGKALRALAVSTRRRQHTSSASPGPTRQAWTTPTSTRSWPRTMPR